MGGKCQTAGSIRLRRNSRSLSAVSSEKIELYFLECGTGITIVIGPNLQNFIGIVIGDDVEERAKHSSEARVCSE
jgi:hypothetical protein